MGRAASRGFPRILSREGFFSWNRLFSESLKPLALALPRRSPLRRGRGGSGRADWIRTSDLCVPNAAHYQAVLQPEKNPRRADSSEESGYAGSAAVSNEEFFSEVLDSGELNLDEVDSVVLSRRRARW